MRWAWNQTSGIVAKQYVCGYCGDRVASKEGYVGTSATSPLAAFLYVCPGCTQPTFFDSEAKSQIPGVAPGNEVDHLPAGISSLYGEARRSAGAGAHTAAVLACRKLLMNIAVEKGAKPGESFISYVEYLAGAGYVPPNGRGWVDHIRAKGNEATHEIKVMTPQDSAELIAFAEMLLKFVFEFPAKVPKPKVP
jgi:hypothetical protein